MAAYRYTTLPNADPPGFDYLRHEDGSTHCNHILRLALEASHAHLGLEPAGSDISVPHLRQYHRYLGVPDEKPKPDLHVPTSSYKATFESQLPPELRDLVYDYVIGPFERQVIAPPVSNYCIGYDYYHPGHFHFRSNLRLARQYDQRLCAALKSMPLVLYATLDAEQATPERFFLHGLLDCFKERAACDPSEARPSCRPRTVTDFACPVGAIVGAAVQIETHIRKGRYTDIGFDSGAIEATRAIAERIATYDVRTYYLEPESGEPNENFGCTYNPDFPDHDRVRSLTRFVRQAAVQLHLNRSVHIKLDVGPWDLTNRTDRHDVIRDLGLLSLQHGVAVRLTIVTAAVFQQQWIRWLALVSKHVDVNFETRELRDGEEDVRLHFLRYITAAGVQWDPEGIQWDPFW